MKPVCVAFLVAVALSACPPVLLCAQQPDSFPTHPPAPAPLAPVRFPPFEPALLPNGMTLIVVARHEQPVASVTIAFRAGALYDPAGKEGLSGLTADLLTKGAGTRTADQLASTKIGRAHV